MNDATDSVSNTLVTYLTKLFLHVSLTQVVLRERIVSESNPFVQYKIDYGSLQKVYSKSSDITLIFSNFWRN